MVISILYLGLAFLLALILSAGLFLALNSIESVRKQLLTAVISVVTTFFIVNGLVVLLRWYPYDFISDVVLGKYLLCLAAPVVLTIMLMIKSRIIIDLMVLILAIETVFIGNSFISFVPESLLVNKLLTGVGLAAFSLSFRAIAGFWPLIQLQSLTVGVGYVLIYCLGAAPFLLGVYGAALTGAMIVALIFRERAPFGPQTAVVIGFIIGWLGIMSFNEFLLPCFLIFNMYFFGDFVVCSFRWLTFMPEYRKFEYNSVEVQSFKSGFFVNGIVRMIWMSCLLLLILGLFQINADNEYSLLLFAMIMIAWQLYRMTNWQIADRTLKETNQEVIKEIKNSWDKIFANHSGEKSSDKKDD